MRFKNILAHVDCQAATDPALDVAQRLAKRHGAHVTVMDVNPDLSWPLQHLAGSWEQTIEDISGGKKNRLREKAQSLIASGIMAEEVLSQGRLSVAIENQVTSAKHDLVIKVAERGGTNRSGFLGSTDFRLLRNCPCPVLILRDDKEAGFQRVAVAVDVMDGHEIQRRLDERVCLAAAALYDRQLALIYALPDIHQSLHVAREDQDLITQDQLAKWETELDHLVRRKLQAIKTELQLDDSETHVLRGEPEEAIPEFVNAHGIDLLVMGTIARAGLEGLLIGNTADRTLHRVECSVLALKPEDSPLPI